MKIESFTFEQLVGCPLEARFVHFDWHLTALAAKDLELRREKAANKVLRDWANAYTASNSDERIQLNAEVEAARKAVK